MKNYYSFARTSIGFSHIESKKPCQDYSATYENDNASVIVVSDGHGSSNCTRSERGSKFACDVTIDAVKEFLQDLNFNNLENEFLRDGMVTQLCKNILLRWNFLVDEDATNNPFTEDEVEKVAEKYKQQYLNGKTVEHAYGCTLILAILTRDFCLAIRNGDGQCVTVDCDGEFTTPIPWNDNCEFNITTSLCDDDAIDDFRYFYSTTLPVAVFASSDGVDDSYTSVEELFNLYRGICMKALNEGFDTIAEHVEELLPELSRRGSTDDVSIAGLINPNELEKARAAMEAALERYQMQLLEAKREKQKTIIIRDIKVAEKKKSKAIAQLQAVQKMLHELKENKSGFLEQISVFRKKADDCDNSMDALAQTEKQLADIINQADSDIDRLENELRAMGERIEHTDMMALKTPPSVEVADGTVTETICLPDCVQSGTDEQETVSSSLEQNIEFELILQKNAQDVAENNTTDLLN